MSAAGLGLEPAALRRLSGAVLRLALLPGLVEVAAVAVASYLLLNLPWLWGAMLGLRKRGFVVDGGIATIIVAAASLDDVIAFTAFQGIFSVIFSSGDLGWRLSQGPIGLLIGLGFGLTWGAFCGFVPHHTIAALGPVALDAARALQPPSPLAVARGRVLLNVNVLSILLTAPAGAAFMALGGPRLLRRRAHAQQLPGPPRTPDAETPVPQSSGDHTAP
ncbi:Mitochondrial sodium/hydrogen exchanger NHA2 [Gryllus bimaculatus]|nr:Mitochondrial sodium/hydrogen exchanger NHA2 [Gryllus bimaculatus]